MILIIPFVFLFFLLKKGSLSKTFIIIQIISLIAGLLTGRFFELKDLSDVFWLITTFIFSCLIILPFKDYFPPKFITANNPFKINSLTKLLIIINAFVFIIFAIAAFVVQTTITDINEFKYSEGESVEFYYTALPFNPRFFNIAILFHYFCYFLLPLHFYYLNRNKLKLAFLCLILSLNVVLFGLTFFSRAILVQYTLLYLVMYYLLKNTIPLNYKRVINRSLYIIMFLVGIYFVSVSTSRFEESDYYADKVMENSYIQNEQLYSYFDYLGQGLYNNLEVLKLYDGSTFLGQTTFQSLLSFLNQFGIINYNVQEYRELRESLWPYPYFFVFNSYTSYVIFDFGVFFGTITTLLYYFVIKKIKPSNGKIEIEKLFLISLLIQVPIMAIFYNQIGSILFALLIYLGIHVYLKYKFNG